MLQFLGRNINSELDLLKVKAQAIDFIRPLKFDKGNLEKLSDLIYELVKVLVLNHVDAYIIVNSYKQERRKGIEIYVYTQYPSTGAVQEILKNDYNFEKKGISFDKSVGFLDIFEVKKEPNSKAEIHIIKWAK